MGALRPVHIVILLVVVLLLFGARRLPDLARSVGQSLKIFKDEVKDLTGGDGGEQTPTVPVPQPPLPQAPLPQPPGPQPAAAQPGPNPTPLGARPRPPRG